MSDDEATVEWASLNPREIVIKSAAGDNEVRPYQAISNKVSRDLFDSLDDEVQALREENQQLRERLNKLEEIIDPDPGSVGYDQLTKEQKVRRIRVTLIRQAQTRGTAKMNYKNVSSLFNGHPSPGHCYDLMRRAGELDGFNYQDNDEKEKRVVVNLTDVNDDALVHAANNEAQDNPA